MRVRAGGAVRVVVAAADLVAILCVGTPVVSPCRYKPVLSDNPAHFAGLTMVEARAGRDVGGELPVAKGTLLGYALANGG